MEAHHVLSKKGYDVCSFGTNTMVRLPGVNASTPNVYAFGTPYSDIIKDLQEKDSKLYTDNGILQMMQRNAKIKTSPERFQDREDLDFDVIITCEERCFDIVTEEINSRGAVNDKMIHIINFEIKDNQEEATVGARNILQFVTQVTNFWRKIEKLPSDLEGIEEVIEEFSGNGINILHTVALYWIKNNCSCVYLWIKEKGLQ